MSVSPEIEDAMLADAEERCKSPSDVIIDALRQRFLGPTADSTATPIGEVALAQPRYTLDEADARLRTKYGLPSRSPLTREELAASAIAALAAADPVVVAEAERLGLV